MKNFFSSNKLMSLVLALSSTKRKCGSKEKWTTYFTLFFFFFFLKCSCFIFLDLCVCVCAAWVSVCCMSVCVCVWGQVMQMAWSCSTDGFLNLTAFYYANHPFMRHTLCVWVWPRFCAHFELIATIQQNINPSCYSETVAQKQDP